MRVGIGDDLHLVDADRTLVLGGVVIEEGPGLAGHSDADVLLHAITDAVLGAAALGDMGTHFPSSDDAYAGADSADLLRRALVMARDAGWRVVNVDSTVRAQRPRLAPYLPLLTARVAEIMRLDQGAVSVKAKSSEGVDSVGEGRAMSATAVVLLEPRQG